MLSDIPRVLSTRSKESNVPISPDSIFLSEDKEIDDASARLCCVMFLYQSGLSGRRWLFGKFEGIAIIYGLLASRLF